MEYRSPFVGRACASLLLFCALAPASTGQALLQNYPSAGAGAETGRSVTTGDIDGDGAAEVLVGEPGVGSATGRVSVYAGGGSGLLLGAPILPTGFSAGPGGMFGEAVATGDLNGDGFDEVIVGAPGEAALGPFSKGTVTVYDGAASVASGTWTPLFPKLVPTAALSTMGDDFGAAVVVCGDVNSDGTPDFAVGAPRGGTATVPAAGYVDVYSGATAALLWRLTVCPENAARCFGRRLDSGNFLGFNDLAIGYIRTPTGGSVVTSPAVFIYSGPSHSMALGCLFGPTPPSKDGDAFANVGDLDGDGKDELLLGRPLFGSQGEGKVTVESFSSGVTLSLPGTTPGGQLGIEVGSAGDVDGDGLADIAATGANGTRVFHSLTFEPLWSYTDAPASPYLDPSSIPFACWPPRHSLATVDTLGDQFPELVIGDAPVASAGDVRLVSPVDPSLALDSVPKTLSRNKGARVRFALKNSALPGNLYIVLGSLLGTSPGLPLTGTLILPLNVDFYFSYFLANANTSTLVNTFALLDTAGRAEAALDVPAGLLGPAWAGLTIHHAYVVLRPTDGAFVGVSNPVELLVQ